MVILCFRSLRLSSLVVEFWILILVFVPSCSHFMGSNLNSEGSRHGASLLRVKRTNANDYGG